MLRKRRPALVAKPPPALPSHPPNPHIQNCTLVHEREYIWAHRRSCMMGSEQFPTICASALGWRASAYYTHISHLTDSASAHQPPPVRAVPCRATVTHATVTPPTPSGRDDAPTPPHPLVNPASLTPGSRPLRRRGRTRPTPSPGSGPAPPAAAAPAATPATTAGPLLLPRHRHRGAPPMRPGTGTGAVWEQGGVQRAGAVWEQGGVRRAGAGAGAGAGGGSGAGACEVA